MNIHPAKF